MDPGSGRAGGELPTVSVVVPTYNRRDNLPGVVAPLLEDPATTEVVVVVDGCRDGSLELLWELADRDPRVRPLFIDNRGTAGAHQAGVEHATGDVVLLTADDVIAAPGLVTGHARHHAAARRRVVVGYMPIDLGVERRRLAALSSWLYAREYEAACRSYEEHPPEILRSLWGGNVSLRREDCLRVPAFTERFDERYHEDREFGVRCLKAGLTGVFDRSLLARHAHERSLDAMLRDSRRAGAGWVLVHRLHGDVLGPADPAEFEANIPAPARWMVRLARRPGARVAILRVLRPVVGVAGRLALFAVERRAAQLMRRIERQAGALARR